MGEYEDNRMYGVDLIKVHGKNVSIWVSGKDLNKLGKDAFVKLMPQLPSTLEDKLATLEQEK